MQPPERAGGSPRLGQTLFRGKDALHVDKTFVGGEIPPRQIMQGGGRVVLAEGEPSKPTVHLCECTPNALQFFYDDGAPLNRAEDTEILRDHRGQDLRIRLRNGQVVNIREEALEFVARQTPPATPRDSLVTVSAPALAGEPHRGGVRFVKPKAATEPKQPAGKSRGGGAMVHPGRFDPVAVLGEAGGERAERVTDPDR